MSLVPLKPLESVLLPDKWWEAFVFFDGTGFRPRELRDHYARIDSVRLEVHVPEDVRQQFETARNVYLYSFFAHRLLPVADFQAYASSEYALRKKADSAGLRVPERWGLRRLFDTAIERKWIVDDGFEVFRRNEQARKQRMEEFAQLDPNIQYLPAADRQAYCRILAESFPSLRNYLAHGTNMIHPSVIGTFEIVADLIHQLFPAARETPS